MKLRSRLTFIVYLFLISTTSFSQSVDSTKPDDEFNLFLFSLLVIFVCAMIGAAIAGAMAAALVLFLFFALLSMGALSTSVAIGLYKKSFSAGFKSFLMILFGSSCAIVGGIGLVLIDYCFKLPTTSITSLLIGATGGLLGGLLLASATLQVVQWSIRTITEKLQLS